MDYYEVEIVVPDEVEAEILIARLAEIGFESFTEEGDRLRAYIPENQYREQPVREFLQQEEAEAGIRSCVNRSAAQNWNAICESGYEPVVIDGKCRVRAPFHEADPSMPYELIIEPRMSFGTAHHETTSLMLSLILDEKVAGKRVLDMGCGTAVLAILAEKMGAASVVAVDNDEWAYSNALDNVVKNETSKITVLMGEADAIPLPAFDLIIANINRNILLRDIPVYAGFLNPAGVLLLSGFYEEDLEAIKKSAAGAGLKYSLHRSDNKWVGAAFTR